MSAALARYRYRVAWWALLRWWFAALRETLGSRRLARLVEAPPRGRDERDEPSYEGLAQVPTTGGLVLAVNHFADGATAAAAAHVLRALGRVRSDASERALLTVGRRTRALTAPQRALGAPARALVRAVEARWRAHVLVLSLDPRRSSPGALRRWSASARERVSFVYPEGRAARVFGALRPGAGRFLATLDAVTVPVGVWYVDGRWHVRVGAPLVWARERSLRDAQLGLAIAALLPAALQGGWRDDLARWRAAREAAGRGARAALEEPPVGSPEAPPR